MVYTCIVDEQLEVGMIIQEEVSTINVFLMIPNIVHDRTEGGGGAAYGVENLFPITSLCV